MADTSHSPAGTGEAIPALYRRYLEACELIELADIPSAQDEAALVDVVEAFARSQPRSADEILTVVTVFRDVFAAAGSVEGRLLAAIHTGLKVLTVREAHPVREKPTANEATALDALRQAIARHDRPVVAADWLVEYRRIRPPRRGQDLGALLRAYRNALIRKGLVIRDKNGQLSIPGQAE